MKTQKKSRYVFSAPRTMLFCAALFCLALPGKAFAQCEDPVSASSALTSLAIADVINLNNFFTQELNFIDLKLGTTARTEVTTRLDEFDTNILSWLSNWWTTGLSPDMRLMTKQINVAGVDQSRQLGSMMDAQQVNQNINKIQEEEINAHRRYKPNELSCQVDTLAPAANKAFRLARALPATYASSDTVRRGNTKGSAGEAGRGAALKDQWDEYIAKFCDPARGDLGCTSPGTMPGAHTDIPAMLWGNRQTIDMSNPENRLKADAAMRYLISPALVSPIPAKVVEAPAGQEAIAQRRSRDARLNTVYNTIGQMLAARVGGSGINTRDMNTAAGVPTVDSSTNASYREVQEALTRSRFYAPDYIVQLVEDPEQIVREMGSLNAIQLQSMNDIFKRNEEMVFMEAASFANTLDKEIPESPHSAETFK